MAVNEVIVNGETIVDLKSDTVTPETLAAGTMAHAANGEQIIGLLPTVTEEEWNALGTTATEAKTAANNASNKVNNLESRMNSGEFKGADGYTPVKGVDYFDGQNGKDGVDGKDYVLTSSDKLEIAEMVEGATVVQAPKFVHSVEEMTDINRPYVLASTGHIWSYMDTTVEQEVTITDNIVGTTDNPYVDGNRLSSSTASDTFSNDASGYHLTPLIDLTKAEYQGKTIQLHLEGAQYASTGTYAQWIQTRVYKPDKSVRLAREYTCDTAVQTAYLMWDVKGITVTYNSETSAVLTIDVPTVSGNQVGYLRFCGKGAVSSSNIYINYQDIRMVTGGQWVDTGTTYAPTLTDEDREVMKNEIVDLIDTQLLSVVGNGAVTV